MNKTSKVDELRDELLGKADKPKGKKASLPQVLEQGLSDIDSEYVARQLERALALKAIIGVKPDEKKNVVGSGLLKDMDELKEELGVIAAENGLEGMRHNNVVFTQRLQAGKTSVPISGFVEELLSRGVTAAVIADCLKDAEVTGESFWVREISSL